MDRVYQPLILFVFLPVVGIVAGASLPNPPRRSGYIAIGLSLLSLIGSYFTFISLDHWTLGWMCATFVAVGAPLAAAYSALSLRTTRNRSLAVAGLLLSLGQIAGWVIVIIHTILNLQL